MFSSLDRVDIVTKGKDGQKSFVQTDHRSVAEIEEQPELSVVFALIRVLNPKRLAEPGEPQPSVIYSTPEPLPEDMTHAIRSAGGGLMVGDYFRLVPDDGGAITPLGDVLQEALGRLAIAVGKEFQLPHTPQGVEQLEGLFVATPDRDEDGVSYWSAVVKLGAFAGDVIRRANGGLWVCSDQGTLPLSLETTFRGEAATVNPLGKAIKCFANGSGDSVAELVRIISSNP